MSRFLYLMRVLPTSMPSACMKLMVRAGPFYENVL
jgi:hypothetical protein